MRYLNTSLNTYINLLKEELILFMSHSGILIASLIWGLKRALNNMSKVMEGAVGMGLLEFVCSKHGPCCVWSRALVFLQGQVPSLQTWVDS